MHLSTAYVSPPPPPLPPHSQAQSPTESSRDVELLKLIRLENENRQLKEKSDAEIEELRIDNARLRADLLGMEGDLYSTRVSLKTQSPKSPSTSFS